MSISVRYLLNTASEAQIAEHLRLCDPYFVPHLSGRVDIGSYAQKIASRAAKFEAWSGDALIGLVVAYCNDQASRIAYVTSVSVLAEWMGKGIAMDLLSQCVKYAKEFGMRRVDLEVARDNFPAIELYKRIGFAKVGMDAPFVTMNLYLQSGEEHEQPA